jgi:Undecaprenyl-phosphate glucose phosphotransferase
MELGRQMEKFDQFSTPELCSYRDDSQTIPMSGYKYSFLMLLADAVSLGVSGITLALSMSGTRSTAFDLYLPLITVASMIFLLVAHGLNVYKVGRIFDWRWVIWRAAASFMLTFAALMVIGIATKTSESYSRIWFFSWLALSLTLAVTLRVILLTFAEAKFAQGACLKRALIVNCGGITLTGDQLTLEAENRIRAVGTITVQDLTSIPDLSHYLRRLSPDLVILSLPWSQVETAMSKFKALSQYAVEILVLPQASEGFHRAIRLRRFGNQVLLQVAEPPLAEWDIAVKRVEDLVIASLSLLLAWPLLLLVALAIKVESKGPILFKQMRAGFNGELIEVWKFRSMYVEYADYDASRQTNKNDHRVTRVGRFIRRSSIDELPQFWNVLQGRMSVVGPRPHALATSAEGKQLSVLVEEYVARHRVKPGITGWAQVNGARGELYSREQVKKRVDYDLYYIANWSIVLDVKIILMTCMRVFHDPRAY